MLHSLFVLLVALAPQAPTADDPIAREGTGEHRSTADGLEGRPAPAWHLTAWANTGGEYWQIADLYRKVVVLHFFEVATEEGRAQLAATRKLVKEWSARDVVWVGVHASEERRQLASVMATETIDWPVAIDIGTRTRSAYVVDDYPDYSLIARDGTLRYVDVASAGLERALEVLAAEEPPKETALERVDTMLANWAYETYEVRRDDRRIARLRLVTRRVDVVGDPQLQLFDDIENTADEQPFAVRSVASVKYAEHLPMFKWGANGKFGGSPVRIDLELEGTSLTGTLAGENVQEALSSEPVGTETTLLRVAACLPFEVGVEQKVERLEGTSELKRYPGELIRAVAWETLKIGALPAEQRVLRFEHRRQDGSLFGEYWFTPERKLLQARFASESVVGKYTYVLVPRQPAEGR